MVGSILKDLCDWTSFPDVHQGSYYRFGNLGGQGNQSDIRLFLIAGECFERWEY